MADTLNNIQLPTDTWVDLYAATGISVGEAISVENTGASDVYLVVSDTQPDAVPDAFNFLKRDGDPMRNNAGDSGAWALSRNSDGKVNISRVAVEGFRPTIDVDLGSGLGKGINLDAWGTQLFEKREILFKSLFTFDVPQRKFEARHNGVELNLLLDENFDPQNSYVFSSGGLMNLTTDGVASSETYVHSRRNPQYNANRGHRYACNMIIDNPGDGCVYDWGLFTPENGVYFRVDGAGNLRAIIESNNTIWYDEPIVLPDGFQGFDLLNNNIYDIQFQWRSAGDFFFFIGSPVTGLPTLVHHAKNLGTLTVTSIENASMPAGYRVVSDGTNAGSMKTACVDISTEGGTTTDQQYESVTSGIFGPSSIDDGILVLQSPLFIDGKTNTRDASLARITVTSDKKTDFEIHVTRDPTAITLAVGASYERVAGGSYMLYVANGDIDSIDTAKTELLIPLSVLANDSKSVQSPDQVAISFWVTHGDYIVIITKTGGANLSATIEWGEEI